MRRLVWHEGARHPFGIRDGAPASSETMRERLPPTFMISAQCVCGRVQHADCSTVDGVWSNTVRVDEEFAYGEYQPEYVLQFGLPTADPFALATGAVVPIASLVTPRRGAVLYVSRTGPLDVDTEVDGEDWTWEIEILERRDDGSWDAGNWNYDPWPDPTIELTRATPALLLSDVLGIVTESDSWYVVGGMASYGAASVDISAGSVSSRAAVSNNGGFLIEIPRVGVPVTFRAVGIDDEVILAVTFTVPTQHVGEGTKLWSTEGVTRPLPPRPAPS